MSFPAIVKSTLWNIVDKMSDNIALFVKNPDKDFSRNRKLGFSNIIRFFLTMQSGCLGQELLHFFNFASDAVPSTSAFIQQRAKLLPFAFRHILREFNGSFATNKYKGRYSLIAVDGSEFNIARNPSDSSTFHPSSGKSKRGFNMLHAVSLYDLLSKRYLDVLLQPGREKNEFAALCDLVDRYSYGGTPVFIADRGFSSYNVFAHMLKNDVFFAIRAKDINTKRLTGFDSLPEKMDMCKDVILTRSNSVKKRLHPELAASYRYICNAVTFDFITDSTPEFPMHLRIVRFEIKEGVYENIITNLPQNQFPADEIKRLYNLRWEIETSFRDLKKTIGTVNFHAKSPQYIEFEILSRMILYNFCTVISLEVPLEKKGGKWEYQINLSMAIKICFSFLRDEAMDGNINKLIGSYILPIRPNRTYERKLRFQAPVSFAYRFI